MTNGAVFFAVLAPIVGLVVFAVMTWGVVRESSRLHARMLDQHAETVRLQMDSFQSAVRDVAAAVGGAVQAATMPVPRVDGDVIGQVRDVVGNYLGVAAGDEVDTSDPTDLFIASPRRDGALIASGDLSPFGVDGLNVEVGL